MAAPFQKPTEVELWNPRATFRQSKDGNIYRVGFEVDKETWEAFLAPLPGMRLRGILWEAADDESDMKVMEQAKTKKKKEPEPKGPWGKFWQEMHRAGYHNAPGLAESLKVEVPTATEIKLALRALFKVDSLTYVGPDAFEAFCDGRGLVGLITIIRQCAAKATAEAA